MSSRQFPHLTEDERARVLTPERACEEPETVDVDRELCAFLATPRDPPPVDLDALFLGPQGENADLVQRLLIRAFQGNVDWRRGFHPEDRRALPAPPERSEAFRAFWDNLEGELFALLAELKTGEPFYSPRYLSHFISDISLPALLGYVAAMFYNPNNVSWEASTITTLLEVEAGRDLARMLGFGRTPEELSRTWGHITSGGTVANLEALWVAKAATFVPIAVREAARKLGIAGDLRAGDFGLSLDEMTAVELVNLSLSETLDLRERFFAAAVAVRSDLSRDEATAAAAALLNAHDIQTLGDQAFFARLDPAEELSPAVVIAPQTMHYGWTKAARVLGLGSGQLISVPVDRDLRMDTRELRAVLERCIEERRPVLMVVGVASTTEEGAVDAMDELVAIRDELRAGGLGFFLHCDAAYGGYFAACFRDPAGELRPLEEVREEYGGWPTAEVYRSFAALSEVDGAAIDPHKLGYVPYPAGAVVFRDGRVKELLAQQAPYALGGRDPGRSPGIYLGRYILEGSKPGAAAAAVCLAHRVVPLDRRGYGKLLGRTCRIATELAERLRRLSQEVSDEVVVAPLAQPDTNVVVYLLNPAGNRRLDLMNRFTNEVYRRLSIAPDEPVDQRRFIVSHTELEPKTYHPRVVRPLLEELVGVPGELYGGTGEGADDRVVLLRSAMMNPHALARADGDRDYLDLFLEALLGVMGEAREVVMGPSTSTSLGGEP